MSADPSICAVCKVAEPEATKIVTCVNCYKSEHTECKGVYGSSAAALRAKPYFCSVQCCEIHHRCQNPTLFSGIDDKVMSEILIEVRKTNTEMHDIQQTMGELKRFNTYVGNQIEVFVTEIKSVKRDYVKVKQDVGYLQSDQKQTNETISDLLLSLDRVNRAALIKNAVILGVPTTQTEDTKQLVRQIAAAVKCQLPQDAIVEATRLVSKDPSQRTSKSVPIRVVFAEEQHKEDLFAKKKNHGLLFTSALGAGSGPATNRIIIRDEMTSFGMKLLKDVRSLQEQADIQYVWPGRDGVILTKKSSDSKVEKVRSLLDVRKLQQSKRSRDESLLHSTDLSMSILALMVVIWLI